MQFALLLYTAIVSQLLYKIWDQLFVVQKSAAVLLSGATEAASVGLNL